MIGKFFSPLIKLGKMGKIDTQESEKWMLHYWEWKLTQTIWKLIWQPLNFQ